VVLTLVFQYEEPRLDYMFEDDDPTANISVAFPLEELALRLDSSGHQHGSPWYGSRPDFETLEASLDNGCIRAWFRPQHVNAMPALHVVGIEANDECEPGSSRESLLTLFDQSFVARLEGALPPLDPPPPAPTFIEFSVASAPSFLISGSMDDARRRLDGDPLFYHAVHGGVFYLHESACSGRFRLAEEPESNAVRVVALGYARPCAWGTSDVCFDRRFENFLQHAGDSTSTPSPTLAPGTATPTPCPEPTFPRRP
jgi:hypothetical protein